MDEKLQEYADKFGEGFPMMPAAWGRTEEEVIRIIDECISKDKDAYALGYVEEDDNAYY